MTQKTTSEKLSAKLAFGIVILIILSLCLCGTTFALAYSIVSVENNLFKTGAVSINLNDGKPVIEERDLHLEPGVTVSKEFFIENNGTGDVYYKIYFDNVDGGLADVLEITVSNGDKVLYQGTANQLNRQAVTSTDDALVIGERRVLTVEFYFPQETDNAAQEQLLSFDLCADAVQTKNNPDREFD